ncbi:RluA family pseudouridine synthase [Nitratifractor salsuginis]|uniref:Pseudouridine synthase n=1 Tax=Nitratifractor salsuginis (strain DSM 16511 / JCM 12458 / E9I37-1) TaxID=749222 RepID=E6X2P8_NITSE|nr:RluA family pseudouridine synthase [Nitratifractor salsuginis]ADV46114.1 ribosomal large subunit pseudouridine synthase D [Nitratifractor salsuginis DSM 16511]
MSQGQKSGEIVVSEGGRLDKVLSAALGASRNQVARLIEAGAVSVEGIPAEKASRKVEPGERIAYRILEAPRRDSLPVEFDVEVLYEDEYLMILNKPAGVVVHPAPSVREPTLVHWLVQRGISLSTLAGEERHGIVHRLDKETSGALVIAKTNAVHQALSEELKSREMGRYYLALIDHPLKEDLTVDAPIARNPANRLKMAVVEGGREARTDFLKLAEGEEGSELIAARLHTGRTHQIRVHLAKIGRHILGDELYGYRGAQGKIPRVFLHAARLYLTHPATHRRLEVSAPIPEDMREYLRKHYTRSTIDETTLPDRLPELFARRFPGA